MLIRDIMNDQPIHVSPETMLDSVTEVMIRKNIGFIVVTEQQKATGVLTEGDLVRLAAHGVDIKHSSVQQHMHSPVFSVKADADAMDSVTSIHRNAFIPEASDLMKHHQTRHLVVIDNDGRYEGLITVSDVAHCIDSRHVEFMRSVMRGLQGDLLASGGKKRVLFECNPNAVFSLDMNGDVQHINPACILLTGYSSDELAGKPFEKLCADDCRANAVGAFLSAKGGAGESLQIQMIGRERNHLYVFMSFVPVLLEGEVHGVYAVAFDITERVLAESRLHRLSQALQQAHEAIVVADMSGTIEFANRRAHQLFGYDSGEMSGRHLFDLEYLPHERSRYRDEVWPAIVNGIPYRNGFLHRDAQGQALDLSLSCSAVNESEGDNPECLVIVYENMAVKREQDNQILHAQKMETIAILAGGVAHDFNNYLAAVTGSLYMMKRKLVDMPEIVERLVKLERLSERAASLVDHLLTFARKDKPVQEVFSCSELIEDTQELASLLVPKNVVQHWQIAEHVYMRGSAGQIEQILLNLLKNSCDAVKGIESPEVSVCLSVVEVEREFALRKGAFPGSYVLLVIRDNGVGIEGRHREFIFDPFFTTKGVNEGTGLGLSMVYGAVQAHQGWIDVQSELGKGSAFHLYFPMVKKESLLLGSR